MNHKVDSIYDPQVFSIRRKALAQTLGRQPALIAAGRPSPRNYAGNTYPFRASSHFLHLWGVGLPGSFGLYDGNEWTLFCPEPQPASALWHGPEPTLAQRTAALGCPVLSREKLSERLAALTQPKPASVAASDTATQLEQSQLLGRPIQPGAFKGPDRDLANALVSARLVHDAPAIEQLRIAAEATAAAHLSGMAATRPGLTEAHIRAAMEAEIASRNMEVAYGSIVTVHGEVLHNHYHGNTLNEGDLLLADVGAESPGGFAGDVTRTWPVNGSFSPTQRDAYDVVLEAQMDTVRRVQPGASYRDLHLNAMEILAKGLVDLGILRGAPCELIEKGAVSVFFPHGIGHLLGLDVHDMEDLGDCAGYAPGRQRSKNFGLRSLRLDRILRPGMAVTIEPGFYQVDAILKHPELAQSDETKPLINWPRLEAFADVRGIRIEDDVLVTADGQEVLSAAIPKTITAVEAQTQQA